jgi:hypothetical protein
VKVTDQRRGAAGVQHALFDLGDRRRSLGQVDGDAHHLRTGFPQLDALSGGACGIGGVGHGHRLHHHGRAAAHGEVTDAHGHGAVAVGELDHLCIL